MNSEKNNVDKLVEHLIRQEIKHLNRNQKEQTATGTPTEDAPPKNDKADSEQR